MADGHPSGSGGGGGEASRMSSSLRECPNFEQLRRNPCWPDLAAAFDCYVASTAKAKGDDCRALFGAVHKCMVSNLECFRPMVSSPEDLELLKDFRGRFF